MYIFSGGISTLEKNFSICGTRPSYDTFALQVTPLPPSLYCLLNYPQNRWGAENTLVATLSSSGFAVYNPCHIIRSHHLHCTKERQTPSGVIINMAKTKGEGKGKPPQKDKPPFGQAGYFNETGGYKPFSFHYTIAPEYHSTLKQESISLNCP